MLFNMSEYTESESFIELLGTPAHYSNSREGRLVKFVRENPRCILIFDEIEKAHLNTIQLFLQILDLGQLDNPHTEKKVSFSDAIIVFTSNACSSIYENNHGNIARTPKSVIVDALMHERNPSTGRLVFPNAICSRMAAGNVILFNHLSIRILSQIVDEKFEAMSDIIRNEYGFNVSYDPRLSLLFLLKNGGATDARIASRQSDKFIKDELYEIVRQLSSHRELLDGVDTLRFELDLSERDMKEDVRKLFVNSEKTRVLVICEEKIRPVFEAADGCEIFFADTLEKMKSTFDEGVDIAFIDLRFGISRDGIRGISLDDYDSIGVRAFEAIETGIDDTAIYLIEGTEKMSESDKEVYLQKGAAGVIPVTDTDSGSVARQISQIAEGIQMERMGIEFSSRGYVLKYNTAQIKDKSVLRILFHSIKKYQAIDSENSGKFIADYERPSVRFNDIIGAENAKEELRYFLDYLSDPRKFLAKGGKPATGLLLYGPPGTGKTMLAKAMAGESDFAFIETSAAEFLSKWVGEGEENVRNLFKTAKKYAPAIIFIDEIDSIGKERSGEDNKESILNALLKEMDGFSNDPRKPVFVLAATNYNVEEKGSGKCVLDAALVRRFSNRIFVDLPNKNERREYLSLAVAKKGFDNVYDDVLDNIATRTPGLSIAILQNIVDLAFRNASKQNRTPNSDDLLNALEEYNFGEKRNWGEDYYKSISIHEAGHAYINFLSGKTPAYITIESRGEFGGYMAHESNEDVPKYSKSDLIWLIRCALAGRASEEVFFGKEESLNSGASSDLQHATQLAISMICNYGMMDGKLLVLPFERITGTPLGTVYLDEANKLLEKEMAQTVELVRNGKEKIMKLADELISKNHMTRNEIVKILKD